ncbi:SRPBCC family protein [Gordoniibacillus kamchatkensis]|uniref:SRPBCC family protein n=1 Tax=Gordoniibacillus kamchatkensis TaxID=1590651 RepID=UPI002F3F9936
MQTQIDIAAPIELCFDLARDIDIHSATVWKHTREKAVAGVTSGLILAGETVTFEATHFLVRQRLTSEIVQMERPYVFVDRMLRGAFKSMQHTHEFQAVGGVTRMTDTLQFAAPFGLLGLAAERLVLAKYMRRFVEDRNRALKRIAERGGAAREADLKR